MASEGLGFASVCDESDINYLVLLASLIGAKNLTQIVIRSNLKDCTLEFLSLLRDIVTCFEEITSI